MDENGERKRETISDHVTTITQDQALTRDQLRFKLKIDGNQLDDLVSYNQLMEYLEDNTGLDNWKIDSTNSDAYKITEAHTILQTLSTLEVVTTYLLNGKLGRKLWNP